MATLEARLSLLAARVRTKINDIMPRLLPSGGATGQALVKSSGSNYAVGWGGIVIQGLSVWCAGKPSASEKVGGGVAPYAFTAIQASCSARAATAATASTVFTIKKNGSTTVGTFTFAAAGTVATVSITSGAFAIGDLLTIEAPATTDTTLSDIAFIVRA